MKKLNLVLRILIVPLVMFFILLAMIAVASGHNIKANFFWTIGLIILVLIIIFIIFQVKSHKK